MTSGIGFECELEGLPSSADVSFYIQSGDSLDLLAGMHPVQSLPRHITDRIEWQLLFNLALKWNAPDSVYKSVIQNLWLEFDYSEEHGYSLAPRFFLKMSEDADNKWTRVPPSILCKLYAHLKGKASLSKQIVELPKSTIPFEIFQVGTSIAKPNAPNRICIRGFNSGDIPALLESLGWTVTPNLLDTLGHIEPLVSKIEISLDVDNEGVLLPRIGFECHVENPQRIPRNWDRFLNFLNSKEWLTKEKYESLKSFSGYTNDLSENGIWLSSTAKKHKILGYQRWIHHIKLSFSENDFIDAKAYLGINLRGMGSTSFKKLCNSQIKALKA
ncbi:hypothetical protein N8703_04070 [Verrucomicrobia bacterium]|nr:hypothetical protein [Verrucomicrobiota bacterium]